MSPEDAETWFATLCTWLATGHMSWMHIRCILKFTSWECSLRMITTQTCDHLVYYCGLLPPIDSWLSHWFFVVIGCDNTWSSVNIMMFKFAYKNSKHVVIICSTHCVNLGDTLKITSPIYLCLSHIISCEIGGSIWIFLLADLMEIIENGI